MTQHAPCPLHSIHLEQVGVRRGRHVVLDHISTTFHCGEMTALMGANGAGKTTLLRAILGEISYSGSIVFRNENGKTIKPRIGYIPQHLDFDRSAPITCSDLLLAGFSRHPVYLNTGKLQKAQVKEALDRVECPHIANTRLGDCSGGEVQRLLLALALEPIPDLLVLDEPVSGMDTRGLEMFFSLVDRLKIAHHMGVLMVSHDPAMIRRFADRVLFLQHTIFADGEPEEVFSQPELHRFFTQGEDRL
ncbi:MAG: metal ABC transporter ATP-binding protein [Christensenellales bacterium]